MNKLIAGVLGIFLISITGCGANTEEPQSDESTITQPDEEGVVEMSSQALKGKHGEGKDIRKKVCQRVCKKVCKIDCHRRDRQGRCMKVCRDDCEELCTESPCPWVRDYGEPCGCENSGTITCEGTCTAPPLEEVPGCRECGGVPLCGGRCTVQPLEEVPGCAACGGTSLCGGRCTVQPLEEIPGCQECGGESLCGGRCSVAIEPECAGEVIE